MISRECMDKYLMLFNTLWRAKRMESLLSQMKIQQASIAKTCRQLPEVGFCFLLCFGWVQAVEYNFYNLNSLFFKTIFIVCTIFKQKSIAVRETGVSRHYVCPIEGPLERLWSRTVVRMIVVEITTKNWK